MDAEIYALASRQGGVFTYAQALSYGYLPVGIQRRLRSGEWQRIRRGAYAQGQLYASLDSAGRHALLVHAVLLALGKPAVVSHSSAAVLHELPCWDLDLSQVHVTRMTRSGGRREAGVVHHRSRTSPEDVTRCGSALITTVARTVVDTARLCSFEATVVLADAALRTGVTDRTELLAAVDNNCGWPDSRPVRSPIEFADGRAESPGESRARVLFRRLGLPQPELQAVITDPAGRQLGRVDFLFRNERTIVEFDGRIKYAAGADALFDEKRREDRLREQGYEVVRITWDELTQPDLVAAKIEAAFARAAARRRAA